MHHWQKVSFSAIKKVRQLSVILALIIRCCLSHFQSFEIINEYFLRLFIELQWQSKKLIL